MGVGASRQATALILALALLTAWPAAPAGAEQGVPAALEKVDPAPPYDNPQPGQALPGSPSESQLRLAEAMPGRRKVPLTLLDAVRVGLTRNVQVKKSLLDRALDRMDLAIAERLFEPEFYLTGKYNYAAGSNSDNRGGGLAVRKKLMSAGELSFSWEQTNNLERDSNTDTDQSSMNLKLSQPLLRNAGVTVGTAEVVTAQNTESSNQYSFVQLIINQITSIQDAYWGLLLALENRLSAIASLNANLETLARNELLIKAGRMAPADIIQTEQAVAQQRVSVLERELAVESANRVLVNLLDLPDSVGILPVEGLVYNRVEVEFDNLVKVAMAKNPSISLADISIRQSELNLELARAGALDQVNLEVSTGRTAQADSPGQALNDSLDWGQGWAAGIMVSIPLGLPRDRLKLAVTRAQKDLTKSHLDLQQSRREVRQLVRDRVNDVTRTLRQIQLAQMSRKLAQQKYEIERLRLELGKSTNFQVLSFQRDLNAARDSEHSAIAGYLRALAALDAAVGTTLETWNVEIVTPVLPKPPSLNLKGLGRPARDYLNDGRSGLPSMP